MIGEIRTHGDMVRDLLNYIEVWREKYHGCGRCSSYSCGHWETTCAGCGAEEGTYGTEQYQKHNEGCPLAKLLAEAEAFILIEEELAQKEMDDDIV